MDKMDKIVSRHWRQLMQLPNVVGVGRGWKTVRGNTSEIEAVVVLVEKKAPPASLQRGAMVPGQLGKAPTDVIEVGRLRLLSSRTAYQRPAHPGISIGHYASTAGTFGAVVRDRKTGTPLILSNNHVLANATNGRDGRSQVGDAILQPGPYDGGTMDQVIGYLERFVPIEKEYETSPCAKAARVATVGNTLLGLVRPNYRMQFIKRTGSLNTVDCAVARPVSAGAISAGIVDIGEVRGVGEARPGIQVQKSGRSSGLNRAPVQALRATLRIMLSETEAAVFSGQIVTGPLAQPGDSGSLVLDMENYAVGLLFAGSDLSSVVNPIREVMQALDVVI